MKIFDELVALFDNHEDIPDDKEFPDVYPRLNSYQFMYDVFSQDILNYALGEHRVDKIKKDILNINNEDANSSLKYICSWLNPEIIEGESADIIFSQAVLEHVDDLEQTYKILYRWLKKGGMMSHQIDFKSHGITDEWNGHWAFSDLSWRIIRGNRPYLLNREPLSTHIKYLRMTGFKISCVIPVNSTGGLNRKRLASRYKKLSDKDLTTSSAHIISRKE